MKNPRTTMQDIANRLNISKNAVSLALNNKPGVSDETREMVISLAKKLNYPLPTSKGEQTNNILVFIPEYIRDDSHFYNDIYWSVDNYSSKCGYNAIMTTITTDMENNLTLPKICGEIGAIGILIIGILQEQYVSFLTKKYQHIVSVDHCYYNLSIPSVVTSNIDGAYMITKEILKKGHRKIGFIGSTSATSSLYERFCGFQRALTEANCPYDASYSICQDSPLNILLSDSEELYELLCNMPTLPTAFFCGGDRIAIACIDALKKMGRNVPNDISVVGFDDIEMGQYITPKLTTMHVKRKEMGTTAVSELLKLTKKQGDSTKTSLYPEFMDRESLSFSPTL